MKKKYLILSASVYVIALVGTAGYKLGKDDYNYISYKKHLEVARNSYKGDKTLSVSSNVDAVEGSKNIVETVKSTNSAVEIKSPILESAVQSNAVNSTANEAPKNNFTKELKKGDSGEEVKLLQKLLKEKGFYKSDITGNMGDATINALKAFEKSIKVTQDGVLDSKTAAKLIE